MKKWEYKIVYINANKPNCLPDNINEQFDEWGNAGWELIKVEPKLASGFWGFSAFTEAYVVIFKREKVG